MVLVTGIMDWLLEICGTDREKVYAYTDARNWILASFAAAANEAYMILPAGITDMPGYIRSLDTKGIITKIIHANLYPEHSVIPEELLLTVYPFEKAAADFVTYAMKELLEE